jgi:hypothetical protein
VLIGTGTLVALTVGGCIYSSTEKERVVSAPASAPAPPPTVVVQQPPTDRVVTYPEGRWQLYGEGTSASPHYWVWLPAGSNPPAPPPIPRR